MNIIKPEPYIIQTSVYTENQIDPCKYDILPDLTCIIKTPVYYKQQCWS